MDAGSYTIVGRLGEGALGTLYEGQHKHTQERAVIRVLPESLSKEPNLLGRLQALQRALARLEPERSIVLPNPPPAGGRDPSIAGIIECGRMADGLLYLASEYVAGESLVSQLRRHAGLPLPNKALRLGRQLSASLTVAHAASVHHLLLRPSQVMLIQGPAGESEQVRILELGLVSALGRPLRPEELPQSARPYLAPEYRREGAVEGGPADVYSLGVIVYQMASGGLPSVARVQLGGDQAPDPQTGLIQMLPSWLQPFAELLDRMVAPMAADRPTMGMVALSLQQLSAMAPSSTSLPTTNPSTGTPKIGAVAPPGARASSMSFQPGRPPSTTSLPEPPAPPASATSRRPTPPPAPAAAPPPPPASARPAPRPAPPTDDIGEFPTMGPSPARSRAAIPEPPSMTQSIPDGDIGNEPTMSGQAGDGQPVIEADYTMSPTRNQARAQAVRNLTHGSGQISVGATPIEPGLGAGASLQVGQLVGNFKIVAKIGQGGMGAVYSAVHRQIGRRAAVKILHGPLAHSPDYSARFLNEARAVNILRHPGLVEIFDFGQLPDGTLYIIMEFLEGESLRGKLRRQKTLPEDSAVDLALQIASPLEAAHQKGIIHRDLKPENVMLVPDAVAPTQERVKVLDFGIAKVAQPQVSSDEEGGESLTAVGTTMGTPKYMAPEQYGDASKVDGKADVFALGVILYEMAAGQAPFLKTSLEAFQHKPKPLNEVLPSASASLVELVDRMLAPKSAERPAMREVLDQLTRIKRPLAAGHHVTAQIPIPKEPVPEPRRNYGALIFFAIVLLFGTATVGLYMAFFRPPPPLPIDRTLVEDKDDLQTDVTGPKARALGVLYQGLRSAEPTLRAQAARALAQSRDVAQWSSIATLLKDPNPVVQAEAAEALGDLGAADAHKALLDALDTNLPPGVRVAVAGALARLLHPRGAALLRELGASTDERIKLRAALLLFETGDTSVSATLREATNRPLLPPDVALGILGRLAQAGDAPAQQQLAARMAGDRLSPQRVQAAGKLAKLGDDRARALLQQATQQPGPLRLLSAMLLSTIGDASGYALFKQVAIDSTQPVEARQVAIEGLGACGRRQGALLLVGLLDEPGASAGLRQSAAGAILQITGGDPTQIARQSLSWAQAALGHDDWLVRQSATAVLGDLDTPESVPLLRQALADKEAGVRKSAVGALQRRSARSALWALRVSLGDAEPEVRQAGMQAIASVLSTLGKNSLGPHTTEVAAQLKTLVATGNAAEQVTAAGTLLELGDGSERERLVTGLAAEDPTLRKLVVEMLPASDELLHKALGDSDRAVRFTAARRLAPRAAPGVAAVLREVLAQGGVDSVIAYGLLKKLGEQVTPPAGFGELLSRGDMPTSLALLDVAAELPQTEAIPVLAKARFDSAPLVRRRVGELAAASYQKAPNEQVLSILYSLLNDPDVRVRTRVGGLVARLMHPKAKVEEEPLPPPDLGSAPDASSVHGGSGLLRILGEEKIRFQVDDHPTQVLGLGPLQVVVAAGRHTVRYTGGSLDVRVKADAQELVQIPVSYAEQLLVDAAEALQRKETVRAQQALDRARMLISRGKASRALWSELSLLQGRLFEGQMRWVEAQAEYDRVLKMPEALRRPEQLQAAHAGIARLTNRLGRIRISQSVDGRCVMIEQWVRPGAHNIEVGGSTREVVVREGGIAQVKLCEGAAAP